MWCHHWLSYWGDSKQIPAFHSKQKTIHVDDLFPETQKSTISHNFCILFLDIFQWNLAHLYI
jgi:hypothetical protein